MSKIRRRRRTNSGNGIKFDGVDDYVIVPASTNTTIPINQAGSLEVVVKINDYNVRQGIYSDRTSSGFDYFNIIVINNIVSAAINTGFTQITAVNIDNLSNEKNGVWAHYVFTKDNSNLNANWKFYMDGVDRTVLSLNTATNSPYTPRNSYIGFENLNSGGLPNNLTDGQIALLRIYDKQLNQSEVNQLYSTLTVPNYLKGNLKLNYEFNQRQGTKLYDTSGNNYHGTLTNFGSTSNYNGGAWVDGNGNTAK